MSTTIDRTELIRKRAYEIYLQRGRVPGRELEDWLTAEIEVDSDLEPIVILEPAQDGFAPSHPRRNPVRS